MSHSSLLFHLYILLSAVVFLTFNYARHRPSFSTPAKEEQHALWVQRNGYVAVGTAVCCLWAKPTHTRVSRIMMSKTDHAGISAEVAKVFGVIFCRVFRVQIG